MTDLQMLALIVLGALIIGFGRSCGFAFVAICVVAAGLLWFIVAYFVAFCIAVFCIALICIILVLAGSD